jgi:hypothetical protein
MRNMYMRLNHDGVYRCIKHWRHLEAREMPPPWEVQSDLQRAPRVGESPGQRDGHGTHRGLGPSRHVLNGGDPHGSTWIHRSKSKALWLVHDVHVKSCQYMSHVTWSIMILLQQSGEAGGRGIRSTAPARAGRSNEKSNRRPGCDLLGFPILKCREKEPKKIKKGHHGRMWQNP